MAAEAPERAPTDNTPTILRRYDKQAARYDLTEAAAELVIMGRGRRRLWEQVPAGSNVLEVGVGTGKNIRWYPPNVSVTAFDFSPKMLDRAVRRALGADMPPRLALMDAQKLAFADATFDVAVASCVFCTVPDPVLGLEEVRRVLKPEGRLVLLEHVRSGLPIIGRSMDLMNPMVVRMSGTNINRETVQNVERAGFRLVQVDDLLLDIVKLIVAEPAGGP